MTPTPKEFIDSGGILVQFVGPPHPDDPHCRIMDGAGVIWVWRAGKWVEEPQADAMTVVEAP